MHEGKPLSNNHMLDHLHIRHFKGFRDLRIEPLGQINLIIGKNNTGKTSLLEALMLWDFPTHPGPALQYRGVKWPIQGNEAYLLDNYLSFFHARDFSQPLSINDVQIHLTGVSEVDMAQFLRGADPNLINHPTWKPMADKLTRAFFVAVPSYLADNDMLNLWWSKIALTSKEDAVLSFVRLIEPRIIRLSLLERVGPKRLYAQVEGVSYPVPIHRFGEGINRLINLVLALLNAEGGMLLIDEIDNGLHHSVIELVWEHLFELSEQYNVQIFATTHNSDCVAAFARTGSQEGRAAQARLIRLFAQNNDIREVDFDIETVLAALKVEVEMR
ncbi:MAG: hypothetical protein OHK0039_19270 [Bacteroidia bacterium]